MTTSSIIDRFATLRAADKGNPLPSGRVTVLADLAIRASLALMPFSAIVWTFVAH